MTTSSATSDNEWQRVVQRITTSDNEWQQVTKNGKEWQQVKTKTTSGTTNAKKWHDKWTWMKANKSDFRFQNKRIMEYITTIYSATSFSKHYVKENICRSRHRRCFIKKTALKNFTLFSGKQLKACNLIKKRLQHKCFPVNIAKFVRTSILKNIWERLLLHLF